MKICAYLFLLLSLFLPEKSLSQTSQFKKLKGGSELGFSLGSFWVDGDISSEVFNGHSTALHWRKGINNVWSIKVGIHHGKAFGLDFMPTGNLEEIYPDVFLGYNNSNPYFFAYKTSYTSFEFYNLFELTNLAPEVYLKNWNVYMGVGVGFGNFSTALNLKDSNGDVYKDLVNQTGFNVRNDYNTLSGRKAIKASLRQIYDDSYETAGPKKAGGFRLGDETNIQGHLLFSLGIARKISPRINVGIDYTLRLSYNDLLDAYDKNIDATSDGRDHMHNASIVLGYNLSKLAGKKPLYWQNQYQIYEDQMANHFAQTDSLLMDDDNDGVFNSLDQQPNSMSNCEVDQFGVTLDSDKDGIPNCIDPHPYLNEEDLKEYMDDLLKSQRESVEQLKKELLNNQETTSDNTIDKAELSRLILIQQLNKPVYFDHSSYELTQNSRKHLLEVSKALKKHADLKLEITGYTSQIGSPENNLKLSELRVSKVKKFLSEILQVNERKIVTYFLGEENLIIEDSSENAFLNRRVEIRIF